jgi:glycosyltransferase involved in cell wall biosynthesis
MDKLNEPLVSVLMTTYNREKYLEAAIESVIASTYKNWELLVVDDKSKDSSVEIAMQMAKKDSRIKPIINKKNLGDYPNRNMAASLAKGKYIKYVDADDMIYPNGLEIMVRSMEQFPEAAWGLSSLPQDKFKMFPFILSGEEAYQRHYFQEQLFHKAPLSAIMRKDFFDKIGGFTGRRYLGDFEMWHILANNSPVVLMPHGIVWYREHEEQEMQNNRTDFTIPFKYVKCAEEMLKRDDCALNESDRKKALDKVYWNQARYILGIGKNHSVKVMKELKSETNFSYLKLFRLAINKP